ncbi:putative nucleotidyltransferase substrate binding domain-containing protein [Persephonella sp.]
MSLDIQKFLKETAPFSLLPEKEIKFISDNLQLDYIPKDEVLLEENQYPDYLCIIIKGAFVLKKEGKIVEFLEVGDFFGDTSIIFEEPQKFLVKAVEDSIILLIPKEIFKKILEDHPEFKEFFTKTTINKLTEGYKKIQTGTLEDISLLTIKEFRLKPPIFCSEEETISQIARKMSENNLSYCLVGNKNNLSGIITDKDLKNKVLAAGKDPNSLTVSQIKTYPVETIDADKFLFEAILKMIRKNIKRLPVIENGAVIGVIEDRDIFIHQSRNILYLTNQIEVENDLNILRDLYVSVEEAIEPLFKTGKDIEILQKYIAEINDRFVQKAVKLSLKELEEELDFSFIVFGSEGRKEQTINTDIDNGIIYTDKKNREKILKLGEKVIEKLLKIGFPECPGKIMASNPVWVKSLDHWKKTVEDWITRPDAINIMYISIFFDFRNVYGNEELTKDLRKHIFKLIKTNKSFLVFMTLKTLEFEPPIGFFRDFIVEKSGEHKDELDLKKGGIFPIVQGVRILALENEISETNTIDRIRKMKDKIGENLSEELIESFKFMQALRLRNQIEKLKKGKQPDNYINPQKLSKFERDLLKDAFKVVKKFQEMLGVHFRLRV